MNVPVIDNIFSTRTVRTYFRENLPENEHSRFLKVAKTNVFLKSKEILVLLHVYILEPAEYI